MIFVEPQLEFLKFIADHRTPFLNAFFKGLNFFDTDYFYFLIIPIAFAIMGKKFGARLFFMVLLSGIVNFFVKDIFQSPRPFLIDPTITLVRFEGYAFPSGAAQGCVLISGIIYYQFRKKWLIPVLALYILLISFSRNYLAAHYPIDILGGWVVGVLLLLFYFFVYLKLEKPFEKMNPVYPLIIRAGFYTLPLWISIQPLYLKLGGIAVGLSIGLMILDIFQYDLVIDRRVLVNIIRSIAACLLLVLIYSLLINLNIEKKTLKAIIVFPILGLSVSVGVIWLANLLSFQKSNGLS